MRPQKKMGALPGDDSSGGITKCARFPLPIHLAFLDHCPNVVVDARACGCKIVVASSGGTKEIAGIDATVVEDIEWDYRPLELYSPPSLEYSKKHKNNLDSVIDIDDVAARYIKALESI